MSNRSLSTGNRWEWRLRWGLSALILAAGMGCFCLTGQPGAHRQVMAYNRQNLVRLHVIANSDMVHDQQVKLKVRDRLLKEAERWLIGVEERNQALRIIKKKTPLFVAAATDELRKYGYHYGAKMEVGVFPFPAKEYAFGWLPAGDYCAVRVTLGRGEGRNWWCVLFPPLCFMPEEGDGQNPVSNDPIQKEKVVYRWRMLEDMLKKKQMVMDDFWRGWGHYLTTEKENPI